MIEINFYNSLSFQCVIKQITITGENAEDVRHNTKRQLFKHILNCIPFLFLSRVNRAKTFN